MKKFKIKPLMDFEFIHYFLLVVVVVFNFEIVIFSDIVVTNYKNLELNLMERHCSVFRI